MADEKPKGTSTQAGEKYIVRFPEGMRERIAEAARAGNRSMNAEILARIESSFAPSEPYATKSQLERVFKKMAEQQDQAMMAVSLVRDMLGSYVIQLFDQLPDAARSKAEFQSMRQLARSAVDRDAAGMKTAAAQLMADVPGFEELEETDSFFEYLGQVNKLASERRRKILDEKDGTEDEANT